MRKAIKVIKPIAASVIIFLLAFIPFHLFFPSYFAQGADKSFSQEIIVKFKPNLTQSEINLLNSELGVTVLETIPALKIYKVKFTSGTASDLIDKYLASSKVDFAETNGLVKAFIVPNDPFYLKQWALSRVNASEGWDVTQGSNTVKIAVVDTGVLKTHPDLSAKVIGGYDFANKDSDATDDNGHGTHVAGIAAAATNNSTGIAGVAWNCLIMPVKVLDAYGSGEWFDVADGIVYAADQGANVINLSLGGYFYSKTLHSATNYALEKNCVVVAATGNDGANLISFPAAYPGVIAVGATEETTVGSNKVEGRANFSNYGYGNMEEGGSLDVVAPGVDILSTYFYTTTATVESTYTLLSGTSMASPHVAGLAALILSKFPSASRGQVENIIELTANSSDLVNGGPTSTLPNLEYGYGRIDLKKALSLSTATEYYLDTYEPNDTPNQANEIDIINGSASIASYIGNQSDTDFYSFTAPVSGYLTARLSNIPSRTNYNLYLYFAPSSGIRDEIVASSTSGGTTEERLTYYLEEGKKYYLEVRCIYGFSKSPYSLDISLSPSPPSLIGQVTDRLGDLTRYLTSIKLSQKAFPYADKVVLTTGENFPDSLCAAPLAFYKGSPILLTRKSFLPEIVLNEIKRLEPNEVIIVGGTGAVSNNVRDKLKSEGFNITRIGGADRYYTSAMVASAIGSPLKKAVIATGENFSDALAISSYAAKNRIPILLVQKYSIPYKIKEQLRKLSITNTIIVGGTGVVSSSVENWLRSNGYSPVRIGGKNRYETSSKIVSSYFSNPTYVFAATGENYPDALCAAPVAATFNGAPVVLVYPTAVFNLAKNYITKYKNSIKNIYVLGGESAVSESVRLTLEWLIPH